MERRIAVLHASGGNLAAFKKQPGVCDLLLLLKLR